MFPEYVNNDVKISLSQDDIDAIQELYGARDGSRPPAQPPAETPEPPDGPIDPVPAPGADTDGDGLSDEVEVFVIGTSPIDEDTDGDGLIDYEVVYGLNPLNPDTDGDGVWDGQELIDGTDPFVPDRGFEGGVGAYAGYYSGVDSEGSGLFIEVQADGFAHALLSVLEFGYEYDYYLTGGVYSDGTIYLVSTDYWFSLYGQIFGGVASGRLETAGGYVGTWYAEWISPLSPSVAMDDDEPGPSRRFGKAVREHLDGVGRADSSIYQPVASRRQRLTHAVHFRVKWK